MLRSFPSLPEFSDKLQFSLVRFASDSDKNQQVKSLAMLTASKDDESETNDGNGMMTTTITSLAEKSRMLGGGRHSELPSPIKEKEGRKEDAGQQKWQSEKMVIDEAKIEEPIRVATALRLALPQC